MSEKILLIIMLCIMLILITCLVVLLVHRSAGLPKRRRRSADFNGGARITDGRIINDMPGADYKFIPEDRFGTVIVNVNIKDKNLLPILRLTNLIDGSSFDITVNGPVVIGRDTSVVSEQFRGVSNDRSVSKNHCVVSVSNGLMYITDHNSSNHTYVNEKMLTESSVLHSGDTLALGKTTKFRVDICNL